MNGMTKKSITWHSPIRLERPSTTQLGWMRQRTKGAKVPDPSAPKKSYVGGNMSRYTV